MISEGLTSRTPTNPYIVGAAVLSQGCGPFPVFFLHSGALGHSAARELPPAAVQGKTVTLSDGNISLSCYIWAFIRKSDC